QVDRFLQLLEGQKPRPGEDDCRGFEWHYWRTQFQRGHATFKGAPDAFSPDGKRLASASKDKMKVWDAGTGGRLRTLNGHTSYVHSVAFSPDGKRLASASDHFSYQQEAFTSGELRVWDAQTGQETLALKWPDLGVSKVSFSPDGKRLASALQWYRH